MVSEKAPRNQLVIALAFAKAVVTFTVTTVVFVLAVIVP